MSYLAHLADNQAIVNGLFALAGILVAALVARWNTRSQATAQIKIKDHDETKEVQREYVHGLKNEINRLLLVIDEKEEENKGLHKLLGEVTSKLHETATNLAVREVEYRNTLKDLERALADIDELKTRVNTALHPRGQ